MSENTNDSANPVLTFEGKKYLINELSNDIKESIKGLQIAEKQIKMYEDTLKLISISRNFLANQLKEKLTRSDVVVVLLHDHGSRYVAKIFNDDWMKKQNFI